MPDRCTLAAEGVLPVTARSRDRQEKGGPLPVHLARAEILSQTHLLVAICSFSPLVRIRYSLSMWAKQMFALRNPVLVGLHSDFKQRCFPKGK